MEALKLHWFGFPRVELQDRPLKLETRKSAALVAYLSLAGGKRQREQIATMFWPEGNQERSLACLRRTISSLNTRMPGWLEADRATVHLKSGPGLWIDTVEFARLAGLVRTHCAAGQELCGQCRRLLDEALALYRGDFLDGLTLGDAPGFDDWQFLQRESLRHALGDVLAQVTQAEIAGGRPESAVASARRWVSVDPLNEIASRALMDALFLSGNTSAALEQYEGLNRILHEQQDREPEDKTRRLAERIRGRPAAGAGRPSRAAFPVPIIKTKLYLPSPPAEMVHRIELLARLRAAEHLPLTLICAPAGFGKTTLLAEWFAETSLPVAWLSLASADNDPLRFLLYLAEALEGIEEGIAPEVHAKIRASEMPDPLELMDFVISALGALRAPSILVIDDYHFIMEHSIHAAMQRLAQQIPPNLHLVISTRADPPFALGRLRAHGQLLELRTRDLRFDAQEAEAFLNDVMRLNLTSSDITTLEARTEGWAAGLQMAALSLRRSSDPGRFIQEFSGSHRHVLDYLLDEVLRGQPPHIQSFLLETSVLEKLSGPLCAAVRTAAASPSGQRAEDVLAYLDQSNLFLEPLDERREWYRYHHLFADLLRSLLQKASGTMAVAALHHRAAEWHEQNGTLLEAIHHASCAVDNDMVERLIVRHYSELMGRGEMDSVSRWTAELSRESVYSRPQLCIYRAYSRSWFGDLQETDALLDAAERSLSSDTPTSRDRALLAHISYVRGRVAAMRGQLPRAIELILDARRLLPAGHPTLQSDMSISLGYIYFLSGDFAAACPVLNETLQTGRAIRATFNVVSAHCILARMFAIQGLLHASYDQYQEAAEWLLGMGGEHLGTSSLISVGRAEVLYEWNDLGSSLASIKDGLASIHWWGKADDLSLANLILARTELARGQVQAAQDALAHAERAIHGRGVFPEAPLALEMMRVRLWLAEGDLVSAAAWADSVQPATDSAKAFGYANELRKIARARVLIALGRADDSEPLLARLEESTRASGRTGRLIEVLIVRALALQTIGRHPDAVETLARALKLAAPQGYRRIFLDEGTAVLTLMESLVGSGLHQDLHEYATGLLRAGQPVSA